MPEALVEAEGLTYPCPVHRYTKTTKRKVSGGTQDFWLVYCSICKGICMKVPV